MNVDCTPIPPPSTLNPQHYSLNPQLSTFTTFPSTLKSQPVCSLPTAVLQRNTRSCRSGDTISCRMTGVTLHSPSGHYTRGCIPRTDAPPTFPPKQHRPSAGANKSSGSRFRVSGFGRWVLGYGFWVPGSGFRDQGSGLLVPGFGFRLRGSGFQASGFGLRVSGPESWGSGSTAQRHPTPASKYQTHPTSHRTRPCVSTRTIPESSDFGFPLFGSFQISRDARRVVAGPFCTCN